MKALLSAGRGHWRPAAEVSSGFWGLGRGGGTGLYALHRAPSSRGGSLLPSLARGVRLPGVSACIPLLRST